LSFWSFLNHWWNLPSLVMRGLVGTHFALQTAGLIEHGGDGDADVDQEIEADAEQELEHDADTDADSQTESEHDVDGATASPLSQSFLGMLGFGRVPFRVVALSLLIFTGFSGLFFNRFSFLHFGGAYPVWLFAISLAASLVVGAVVTHFTARFAGKLVYIATSLSVGYANIFPSDRGREGDRRCGEDDRACAPGKSARLRAHRRYSAMRLCRRSGSGTSAADLGELWKKRSSARARTSPFTTSRRPSRVASPTSRA